MLFIAVLTLITAVFRLQVDGSRKCQGVPKTGCYGGWDNNSNEDCTRKLHDVAEEQCPISLTRSPVKEKDKEYYEKISIQVWMKPNDSHQIKIHKNNHVLFSKRNCRKKVFFASESCLYHHNITPCAGYILFTMVLSVIVP